MCSTVHFARVCTIPLVGTNLYHILSQQETLSGFSHENLNTPDVERELPVVLQCVEALRYKSEGRGFDFRKCHWNFLLT